MGLRFSLAERLSESLREWLAPFTHVRTGCSHPLAAQLCLDRNGHVCSAAAPPVLG